MFLAELYRTSKEWSTDDVGHKRIWNRYRKEKIFIIAGQRQLC